MKVSNIFSVTLLALCVSSIANAAETTSFSDRSPIIFWGDRSDEDWSYVDDLKEEQKSFAENLKRLEIDKNGDWKVSFGANFKGTLDSRDNFMYDPEEKKRGDFRSRLYLSTDVTYQDWLRVYGAIRSNYTNVDNHGPIDAAGNDIHQLFVEAKLLDQSLNARLGRQELYLNDWQLMSREPTSVKSSWNALRTTYNMDNGITLDAYYGEEVFPKRTDSGWGGNWDDKTNGKKSAGLWANFSTDDFGLVRLFVMDSDLTNNSFVNAPHGDVDIQSIGFEAMKRGAGIGYMVDVIYQTGKQADKDISAYMAYADVNYTWSADWNWTLGMNLHYASGSDKDSDKVNTFNPLWTGDALGFAHDGAYGNVMQTGLYTVAEYMPKQLVIAGFMSSWRANTDDAMYTLNQDVLFGADSDEKYAYTQAYLQFHNYLNSYLKVETNLYYSWESDYIRDVVSASAKDATRIELALIYNF